VTLKRKVTGGLLSLLIIFLIALMIDAIAIPIISLRRMADFSDLWNTSDTLMHYVRERQEWPGSFEDLNGTFPKFRPGFKSKDLDFLKEKIEVNFDVDLSQKPQSNDWYVRLKSGRMLPEQKEANDRIRSVVSELSIK